MSPPTLDGNARQIFDLALERPEGERPGFVRDACGADEALRQQVEDLLAAYQAAEAAFHEPPSGEQAGDRIGPYVLLEKIGEGGFGTVWMAEQHAPLRRHVALKILKWGMDTRAVVARFEAERQTLALMDHPHIAHVFDAGQTENGRPYFAMELVHGVPITQFCDQARFTPRERLEVFLRVCEAVQHAHQKGIIHRDLKPGNVLVTLQDGHPMPKVIDFGIAKATSGQLSEKTGFTGLLQVLGTPEYMAPEQADRSGIDVDTRADVYSLGVMLYELLTGTLPFGLTEMVPLGQRELLRRIREVEPERPSMRVSALRERRLELCSRRRVQPRAFARILHGDLDWIVLKALEKERGRRYATAESFGADIGRYLRNEPVEAGPPSGLYHLRKLLRRHWVGTLAAASVGGAAIVTAWMAVVASRAEIRALQARQESEGATGYLLDLFMQSSDRPTINRQLLLEQAERRLIDAPVKDARVAANIHEYIAHGWHKLNYLEKAEPHLARALEIRRDLGVRDADLAECLLLVAMQRLTQGRIDDGRAALRESLGIRRELFGPEHAAGAENGELMYWTCLYLPEEPEAVREFELRRRLRPTSPESPASSVKAPLVFEDGFDGAALDPEWSIEFMDCAGWSHVLLDSRLTVTDIAPQDPAAASETGKPAWVRLTRTLDRPLGDFRVEARIGWDSEDQREAQQHLVVSAYGEALLQIAEVQYGDEWLQFGGARKAQIGRGGPSGLHVNSGKDTLLDRGDAELAIERIGEHVSVYWDGHELMSGLSSDALTEIGVSFLWTVHDGLDGRSSFGSEWIDSIRVLGTPR